VEYGQGFIAWIDLSEAYGGCDTYPSDLIWSTFRDRVVSTVYFLYRATVLNNHCCFLIIFFRHAASTTKQLLYTYYAEAASTTKQLLYTYYAEVVAVVPSRGTRRAK
jgi:hypothetical protein